LAALHLAAPQGCCWSVQAADVPLHTLRAASLSRVVALSVQLGAAPHCVLAALNEQVPTLPLSLHASQGLPAPPQARSQQTPEPPSCTQTLLLHSKASLQAAPLAFLATQLLLASQ